MHEIYENPLILRYASRDMAQIFSDNHKFTLWHRLWIVLAESEKELGIDITDAQIAEMKKFESIIDYETAANREKEVRHDVMAHVYAFGKQAKSAMPIIHLGATSCYVTDNADILMYRDALLLIKGKLVSLIKSLKKFALDHKDLPTLGFTHFQAAQLTTVGKRATIWLQDLSIDYHNLVQIIESLKLRGVKGATGTQASFLSLFNGDHEKVVALEKLVAKKMGMNKFFAVTGQTYPRKLDYNIVSMLSQIAQSSYKFAEDMRLLQHLKEVEEPFEKEQIGSSAMAYKRNPMRCERICSLSRYVLTLPMNAAMTASTQWLERTLDDSANRRITIPQAFLALDAVLSLYINVCSALNVNVKIIEKRISEELPFMATENILMECVKHGGDRQGLHELIRKHSIESANRVKEGQSNDLISRLKSDSEFAAIKDSMDNIINPKNFIGRAPNQVTEFIASEIDPILRLEKDTKEITSDINF